MSVEFTGDDFKMDWQKDSHARFTQIDKQTIEAVAQDIANEERQGVTLENAKVFRRHMKMAERAIQTLIDMGWRPAGEKGETK